MSTKINLTGQRYGRLVVLEESPIRKRHSVSWICKCDCGNITKPLSSDLLRRGHIKSCGCYSTEVRSLTHKKHGKCGSRIYASYRDMLNRCYLTTRKSYKDYGGRGITVCDEWKDSFQAFYEWAIANGYAEGLTIDRIDNDGNYEPSNCRWATDVEQGNNKRNNRLLTYEGKTLSLSQWAKEKRINVTTLHERLSRGWTLEQALTTPLKRGEKL